MSSAANEDLRYWDRSHYWHAFTQMAEYEPFIIERGEGCWLIDIEGRKYLDGAASMWCNVHGHNHSGINGAVRAQLERIAHATSLGMGCATTVKLAKKLAVIAPGNLEHVFFASDGSSALEVALKMAFQYWRQCENPRPRKTKFLALGEAYHGDTIGSASVSGIPRFHAVFEPLLFEVVRGPIPDGRRLPPEMSEQDVCRHYLREFEILLDEHQDELAAVVIEPLVQCAAGIVVHPRGFLRGLDQLARDRGVLLIADEVAVGCGRTGTMFACQNEGVVPDFLCLGKGLSSGYLPISATITHSEIYNAFLGRYDECRTLHHGHTFSGNALASAAALATLELFDEERTLEQLPAKIARIEQHLVRLAEHPHVVRCRQRGMVAALELTADKATGEGYAGTERRPWRICREALQRGVWLRPLADVLYVMPPLAISLEEIDFLFGTLAGSIDAVTKSD